MTRSSQASISDMKRALDLNGKLHPTVAWIEDAGCAGWRRVGLTDGTLLASVSTTELAESYGVDPFVNVNPFKRGDW